MTAPDIAEIRKRWYGKASDDGVAITYLLDALQEARDEARSDASGRLWRDIAVEYSRHLDEVSDEKTALYDDLQAEREKAAGIIKGNADVAVSGREATDVYEVWMPTYRNRPEPRRLAAKVTDGTYEDGVEQARLIKQTFPDAHVTLKHIRVTRATLTETVVEVTEGEEITD